MEQGLLKKITFLLIVVGGINWGLVGLFNFNLVDTVFGMSTLFTKAVYTLVGASALLSVFYMINE